MKVTNTRPNPHLWSRRLATSQLPVETQRVGVVLAALTDDESVAAPGIGCLSRTSGVSPSGVSRALRDLRVTGNVEKIAGRMQFLIGSYDRYRLLTQIG